jgi:glycosyltransferase involved in cell wall biosynthesis
MTSSVLVPSFRRPPALRRCLDALAKQTRPADEVFVVWQADDTPTRDAAEAARAQFGKALRILHSPTAGVVPAENTALAASSGEILLLIDDDAEAPPDWLERHLAHYADPNVGAVGGPADNFSPDGLPFPIHPFGPVGRLTWYGRLIGNAYDQPAAWRARPPIAVDHLVGYNMSLRRAAFDRFEAGLRPYWQLFELDACLQVSRRGFRILFDYANVVKHHPVNTAYEGGRHGDLRIKVYNAAYNHAFIMAKHMPLWRWPFVMAYRFAVGNVSIPGFVGALIAIRRFGHPLREARTLLQTRASSLAGWRDGVRRRLER